MAKRTSSTKKKKGDKGESITENNKREKTVEGLKGYGIMGDWINLEMDVTTHVLKERGGGALTDQPRLCQRI